MAHAAAASSSTLPNLTSLSIYNNLSKQRLQALYADVSRQKHSNPTMYESNVDWWRRTLEAVVSTGSQVPSSSGSKIKTDAEGEAEANKLVLNASRVLIERLRYEGVGKPLGLGAVIAELRNTKALVPLHQFLNSTNSPYNAGWLPYRIASYVVGKPLWWALEQLELVQSEEKFDESEMWKRVTGEYVVLRLVEQAADAVMALRDETVNIGVVDGLYSYESFRREFGKLAMSALDTKVLIRYLERDRRVLVVQGEIIKFVDAGQSAEITAVDKGILELRSAVQIMHAHVDDIQLKIDECTQKISSALRQKRKSMALGYLKSRKQLEDFLTKRLGSLDILQSTLLQVEGAAGDIEIMKSFESSTATLRAILAHPSLQRDKIEETMEAVANASTDVTYMFDAIQMGGNVLAAEAGIDDSELEDELQALIRESERENEEEIARDRLGRETGQVPKTIPGTDPVGEGQSEAKTSIERLPAIAV